MSQQLKRAWTSWLLRVLLQRKIKNLLLVLLRMLAKRADFRILTVVPAIPKLAKNLSQMIAGAILKISRRLTPL